jgi:chromosome partitioning protein
MPQIISFIIQKGGCGKTTTTANAASYLAMQGFTVLAVDMDPQGNLTQHLGFDTDNLDCALNDLFLNQKSFKDVVLEKSENLHLLPNNFEMTSAEASLYKSISREYILRDILSPVGDNYDFILIDCPPNLGILSINALAASTEFIMVATPDFFPMKAIKPLYETFLMVKTKLNRTLQFRGVLLTMCDFRTKHSKEVLNILRKNFSHKLFNSFIRNNVTLREASSVGKSIFDYNSRSIGAFDYQNFVEEFIRDHEKVKKKKKYYEKAFRELEPSEKNEIMQFAILRLSRYNRNRIDEVDADPILKEALNIERNKIIEKLYPYREHNSKSA